MILKTILVLLLAYITIQALCCLTKNNMTGLKLNNAILVHTYMITVMVNDDSNDATPGPLQRC